MKKLVRVIKAVIVLAPIGKKVWDWYQNRKKTQTHRLGD